MAKNLGVVLPIERGANGYFNTTSDISVQIRSNLTNLLLTQLGERPMQPEFGSDLHSHLFENQIDGVDGIQTSIENAVARWMPFITIGDVIVTQITNANTFKVFIPYTFSINNTTDNITLVF